MESNNQILCLHLDTGYVEEDPRTEERGAKSQNMEQDSSLSRILPKEMLCGLAMKRMLLGTDDEKRKVKRR